MIPIFIKNYFDGILLQFKSRYRTVGPWLFPIWSPIYIWFQTCHLIISELSKITPLIFRVICEKLTYLGLLVNFEKVCDNQVTNRFCVSLTFLDNPLVYYLKLIHRPVYTFFKCFRIKTFIENFIFEKGEFVWFYKVNALWEMFTIRILRTRFLHVFKTKSVLFKFQIWHRVRFK